MSLGHDLNQIFQRLFKIIKNRNKIYNQSLKITIINNFSYKDKKALNIFKKIDRFFCYNFLNSYVLI